MADKKSTYSELEKKVSRLEKKLTRSRNAERELREKIDLTQAVLANITSIAVIKDVQDRYLLVNRQAEKVIGLKNEEITGKTPFDLYPAEIADKIHQDDMKVIQSGELLTTEEQLRLDDDKIYFTTKVPLFDPKGKPWGLCGLAVDITEQKKVEEALRASEERFRSLAETIGDWIWEVNLSGILTYASPRVKDVLGYEPEEILGKSPFHLMLPEDAESMAEKFKEMLISPQPFERVPNRFHHKDGRILEIESSGVPIRDTSGKFCGFRGVDSNITRRKEREKTLRESEETVRTILNTSTEPMLLLDKEGIIFYLNEAAALRFGKSVEELIGLNCFDLFSPQLAESRKNYHRTVIQSGLPIRFEEERCGVVFDTTVYPVFDSKKKVVRLSVCARDISVQKASEEALREREKRYRTLFDSLQDAAFLVDSEVGIIREANRQAEVLLGCPREEIIGMHQTELHPPNKMEEYLQLFQSRATCEQASNLDCEIVRKDGSSLPVMISSQTLTFGGKSYVLDIFRDLTMFKLMLERQNKASSLESLSALASGIAHDFNIIFSTILDDLSLADRHAQENTELAGVFKKVERASLKAKNLTGQLRTFSRSEKPVIRPIQLSSLLGEWVDSALEKSGSACELSIENYLWFADADMEQIGLVVKNLIVNAEQAAENAGKIYVEAENFKTNSGEILPLDKGRYVKIKVAYRGSKIPEQHLQKIFDPYFNSKKIGEGLNLAISYAIIRRHRGHIAVTNGPGEKTTFTVYLPASRG